MELFDEQKVGGQLRNWGIDLLRWIAAVGIVGCHLLLAPMIPGGELVLSGYGADPQIKKTLRNFAPPRLCVKEHTLI